MYLIRLDDASEYMNIAKWEKIENVLDKYGIIPIVGVIPNNQDDEFINKYQRDLKFWNKARRWQLKEWSIALHGYKHVCQTNSGGLNPVNLRSEFAGVKLEEQRLKIKEGISIFEQHKISTKIFFAPSHTFDSNTLEALRLESDIRIISDTVSNDVYKEGEFYFVPQQSGHVQKLPFKVTTFCYHPNNMEEQDYIVLEKFISENIDKFAELNDLNFTNRRLNLYDVILRKLYFLMRKIRNKLRGK